MQTFATVVRFLKRGMIDQRSGPGLRIEQALVHLGAIDRGYAMS
jgi:hypothetical protein